MMLRTLTVTIFVLSILCTVHCSKIQKHKKASSDDYKKHLAEIEEKIEELREMEAELQLQEDDYQDEDLTDGQSLSIDGTTDGIRKDPCLDKYCGVGRECVINDNSEGMCQCVTACQEETDVRRRVCSNHNETWMSDCELYRHRCICTEGSEKCLDEKYNHIHIDYYGECQEMPECLPDELADFPRRMREWLFSIMRDMADREVLSEHYLQMEKEAEQDEEKKWTYSVVWKWCELDGHPKDNAVSRHELFPLRAPLYTLEQCIAPFLDSCDPNNDHFITLKEWALCLQLEEGELENLEVLCEEIHSE